jgi:hypothetical protein
MLKKQCTSVKGPFSRPGRESSQLRSAATPTKIAEWMLAKVNRYGKLMQVRAAAAIKEKFGPEFVYLSDIGELSIDRRILYQFRKLSGDEIVWVTQQGGGFSPKAHWRRRESGDAPGRTQYEY